DKDKDREKDKDKEKESEHPRAVRDSEREHAGEKSHDDLRAAAESTVPPAASVSPSPSASTSFDDLLSATQGLRALMIGGSVREDTRRRSLRFCDFGGIAWERSGDMGPVHFDAIERRIRDQGVDLVLILKAFVGDHVAERLQPLCDHQQIPCLLVEHG